MQVHVIRKNTTLAGKLNLTKTSIILCFTTSGYTMTSATISQPT